MTLLFRVPRPLYEQMLLDLRRPHSFASERVGFAKIRMGMGGDSLHVVIATGYEPVRDEHYINDPFSGARINGDAIRRAMEMTLAEDVGILHVHLHDFPGTPYLGRMDRREIPRLVRTFRNTNPSLPHGILLFSNNSLNAWISLPGSDIPMIVDKATVVGLPFMVRDVPYVE